MKIKKIVIFIILIFYLKIKSAYPESFVEDNKVICELSTPEYIELVKPFLPNNPMILEAGAHGGNDTVLLAKSWPLGTVYAFEPVPKFVSFINREIKKHKVANVLVFPYALSQNSGKSIFYYSNQIGAASSLLKSNGICDYQDVEIMVDCINLDEWAEKNDISHIDFMWLDMEGSEYYVLHSASKILKTVQVIISEVNFCEFRKGMTQYHKLYNLLISNNFSLYKIWGNPAHQGTALFIRVNN